MSLNHCRFNFVNMFQFSNIASDKPTSFSISTAVTIQNPRKLYMQPRYQYRQSLNLAMDQLGWRKVKYGEVNKKHY